jgi:hypothetical protein
VILRTLGSSALALTGVLAFAVPAGSAPDPYAEAASGIVCPPGPPGWFVKGDGPDGRFVLTPLTVDAGPAGGAGAAEDAGADTPLPNEYGGSAVEVDCNYWTNQGGHLIVAVRYALPTDFNPFSDFYVGCMTNTTGIGGPTGPQPWDNQGRLYRVLSNTSWSYATFGDSYNQLSGNEVGAFEAITRAMLKTAEPVAHTCSLKVQPTAPTTLWTFGFDANVKNNGITTTGGTSVTFMTRPNVNGGTGQLGDLKAADIVLNMTKGSKKVGSVTLQVTQPVSFTYSYGAAIRTLVQVKSSTYAPCRVGATGTLTVTSSVGAVTLQVCHTALLQGTGATNGNVSD